MYDKVTFTMSCTMSKRWAPYFVAMLNRMEQNGVHGHSEIISFMSDGDGDFRPKFKLVDCDSTDQRILYGIAPYPADYTIQLYDAR